MRRTLIIPVLYGALAFTPSAVADPGSENAGCVAQFVNSLIPVIEPYGEFVSGLAHEPGPLGTGVAAVATNCPR